MLLINSILFMTVDIFEIYKTYHSEGKPNFWIEQRIGIDYGLDINLSSFENNPRMELKEKRLDQQTFKKGLVERDEGALLPVILQQNVMEHILLNIRFAEHVVSTMDYY